MYERYSQLKISRAGKVLTICIDNPPLNEVTTELDTELSEIFIDINRDPDVNVVILTAGGERIFCAGGSIDDRINEGRSRQYGDWITGMRRARRILMAMLDLDVPIIARVQGHAIGLGATLAVYSDIVIAVEDAKFADPHVQIGLTAGDGGAIIWPRLMGLARAKYFLLTGDRMTAAEAVEMGLIHKAVPRAALDQEVDALAQKLAALPRAAVMTTKRAVNIPLLRDIVQSMDATLGLETLTVLSADHLEAVTAFKEKRPPVYVGR